MARAGGWCSWNGQTGGPEQQNGFGAVAARHRGRPVFMYLDSRPYVDARARVELLRMAVDRRTGRGEADWGVIVAIVTGSGADSLDVLPAGLGVLLVRPAVPGAGQQPELRQDDRDGVTGWVSGTGWVLVGRRASGATIRVAAAGDGCGVAGGRAAGWVGVAGLWAADRDPGA